MRLEKQVFTTSPSLCGDGKRQSVWNSSGIASHLFSIDNFSHFRWVGTEGMINT
jgi:hypothetical protein